MTAAGRWRRVFGLAVVWVAGLAVPTVSAQRIAPATAEDARMRAAEAEYYTLETVPVPPGVVLEVGAIDRGPGDSLALVTRRGDLYRVDGAFRGDLESVRFTRVASGFQEPLGVAVRGDRWWVTQRSELTEVIDPDGDGRADEFRTICDGWGISGDPHEYAFASKPDAEGNVWVTLTLTDSVKSSAFLRGWCVRIGPDGSMTPWSGGIRSAGGVGRNREGELFYTESQGYWVGSSALHHLKRGTYQGAPPGVRWWPGLEGMGPPPPDFRKGERIEAARARMPSLVPPAVVFPHGDLGQCPTGFVVDEAAGRFGPFSGQLFVGEFSFSQVQRVFMEEVNGVWQGAAFPFLSGFASAPVALLSAPEGYLLVGQTQRGWGSRGGAPFALERVRWTGRVPFEILEMRVTAEGFHLRFTQPVQSGSAGDPRSYSLRAWTYDHTAGYGSPKVGLVEPRVLEARVDDDRRGVALRVEGRVRGHVHEVRGDGVRSGEGRPLLHPVGYYTLNEIPAP